MPYKITIVKTETVSYKKKEWEIVEKRPYTSEEWSDKYKWSLEKEKDQYPLKEEYGYVETESEKEVETKILEQEVEELYLADIIKAVNKI